MVGILTRSDILTAHRSRLHEATRAERSIRWARVAPKAVEAKGA